MNPDHDDDCGGDHDDGRLPADQDPNLPEWAKGKYYFGMPSVYDGFVYESQPEYLARLKLLTAEEEAILKKYGDISRVRVSTGMFGQCEPCWKTRAKWLKRSPSIYPAQSSFTSFGFLTLCILTASTIRERGKLFFLYCMSEPSIRFDFNRVSEVTSGEQFGIIG